MPIHDATADRMRRVLGRIARYRGALVIVLWQAPVGPVAAPNGGVAFLFGAGHDELVDFNCDGDVISSERARYRVAGLEADYTLNRHFSVHSAVGFISSPVPRYDGGFGAAQLRADAKYIGGGAGAYFHPQYDTFLGLFWPSAHIRFGAAEGVHARADMQPPTVLGHQQLIRFGVGINATRRDRPSGFLGLGGVGGDQGATGAVADLELPLGARGAIVARGHYAPARMHSINGFALGARLLVH